VLRAELAREGFDVARSSTQIIPLVVGDARTALRVCEAALERGVFAQAIRPPTVPEDTSRLRLAVMATHTPGELREAARTLGQAAQQVGSRPATAMPAAFAHKAAAPGALFEAATAAPGAVGGSGDAAPDAVFDAEAPERAAATGAFFDAEPPERAAATGAFFDAEAPGSAAAPALGAPRDMAPDSDAAVAAVQHAA
jgi:glycine C-acetyltransferase/8-amino-7-oxononanoate synthase